MDPGFPCRDLYAPLLYFLDHHVRSTFIVRREEKHPPLDRCMEDAW